MLLMHLGSLVIQLIMSVLTPKDLCSKLHSPVLYFSWLTLNLWEIHILQRRFLKSCVSHWAVIAVDIWPHVMCKS